jgi:16S rRNA (guanine527-N7)-methyltransferase
MVAEALATNHLAELSALQLAKLASYGNLLLRWNERTSLTAIREARGVLDRHIVESVAAARLVPAGITTLLDYGSGAGLPGIPIAVVREEVRVTLAESQGKKAAFLREAVRTLDLNASIHAGRVADLDVATLFDAITLRAVEKMEESVKEARERVGAGGFLVIFATAATKAGLLKAANAASVVEHPLPTAGSLLICRM